MKDRLKFLRRTGRKKATPGKRNKKTSKRLGIDVDDLTLDDSLDSKLAQLKSECDKRKRERSMAVIQELTSATYGNRHQWIQQKQPHVCEILEKYPSLKIRKIVSL